MNQWTKGKNRRLNVGRMLLCSLVLWVGVSNGQALADDHSTVTDVGLGIASVLATIPYGAIKILYAGLGAVTGGFTYVLTGGDLDSANTVWESSLRGTYVLTPANLTGEEPIRFIGP